jgi:hypothetical protein
MIHASRLPKSLWGEAVIHAVWLKNRMSTHVLGGMAPFEVVTGKKPNVSKVLEWGCGVWVHNDHLDLKLEPQVRKAHWVGFDGSSNGHCIYWTEQCTVSVE